MSKTENAPTMIIPSGTEIQIDVHGQLSVRTPGNLVIQNSGHYGEIESINGSIRIEANAEVEAVSVRCADTCYVQGSLTSWKVKARSIQLEEQAKARIVLQETDSIDIGKNAQLVGNFSSEKELFLLFSRFAQQLRSIPFYFDRKGDEPRLEVGRAPGLGELGQPGLGEFGQADAAHPTAGTSAPGASAAAHPTATQAAAATSSTVPSSTAPSGKIPHPEVPLSSRVLEAGEELPDELFFSLVLLEREARNEAYGTTSVRVLEELVKLLRSRDLETLQHTFHTLFGRVVEPGDDVARAQDLIESYFRKSPIPAPPDAEVD